MLACETKGQVLGCLLSGVVTPHLGNKSCGIPESDLGGGTSDPEWAGKGLGSLHGFHGDAGLWDPPGIF